MTQHECSRLGCTRLTSEQECDIHAAEPAGVIHEPKEPRLEGYRWDFDEADSYAYASLLAPDGRTITTVTEPEDRTPYRDLAPITDELNKLAVERDEWKRRAEAAEAEAVRIAQVHQHEWLARASAREAFENYVVRVMAASGADANFDDCFRNIIVEYDRVLARADKAEAERDAARAELADPRIAAWRALDAEQRSYRVEDLRTWADLVEAGAAPDGADHGPSPLRIAAAALEALGEK